jgi:hypothetical protein
MFWQSGAVQKRVHKHLATFFQNRERSFHSSLTGEKHSEKPKDGMTGNACRLKFESFNQLLDVQEKRAKTFRRITSDVRYDPFEVKMKAGCLFLHGSTQLVEALVAARLAEPVAERATVDRRAG